MPSTTRKSSMTEVSSRLLGSDSRSQSISVATPRPLTRSSMLVAGSLVLSSPGRESIPHHCWLRLLLSFCWRERSTSVRCFSFVALSPPVPMSTRCIVRVVQPSFLFIIALKTLTADSGSQRQRQGKSGLIARLLPVTELLGLVSGRNTAV